MTYDEFESLITEALNELPNEFQKKLNNVSVVMEDWPTPQQMRDARVQPGSLLFGLYHGTPQTRRTQGTLYPDKISIFAGPILMVCRTSEEVKTKVRQVVRHEIAHHFGLNEEEIRRKGH